MVRERIDEFHRLPTVGPPYVHTLDGVSFVDEFCRFNNEWIPLVEVLFLEGRPRFALPGPWLMVEFGRHLLIKMTHHFPLENPLVSVG